MIISAYENGGRGLDGQKMLKNEVLLAAPFDDTSDEDASLFEVPDYDEDLHVAPEACPSASELRVPNPQHLQIMKDNFPDYEEEDVHNDFLFDGIQKHSALDDGHTNEDNAALIGHLTKEDGEGGCLERRVSETCCSLQEPSKAFVLVSEPGKGRERVVEMMGTMLNIRTLTRVGKEAADIRTPMKGWQEATTSGNKNADLESHTHTDFVSCVVQQEKSLSRATDISLLPDNLDICKLFEEVRPMRITRSMLFKKPVPKRTADERLGRSESGVPVGKRSTLVGKPLCNRTRDERLDRSDSGIPVGKRTCKRIVARGVCSIWAALSVQNLTGIIDVVPLSCLEKELVGKDNLGHDKFNIDPVLMQQKGRRKGKHPASGKPQVAQGECSCDGPMQDNMFEGESFRSVQNTESVQMSQGNIAGQFVEVRPKQLFKKMQAFGHADLIKPRFSIARKRSKLINKSNSTEAQNHGEIGSTNIEGAMSDPVLPTCTNSKLETDCELHAHRISSIETRSVGSAGKVTEFSCPLTQMTAILEGRSTGCLELEIVDNQMCGINSRLQNVSVQTLQLQESTKNETWIDLVNRSNNATGDRIVDSLASKEAMQVLKQIEEKSESREPILRVEGEQITDVKDYGEAVGMQVKLGIGEVSPQRDQCCSGSDINLVDGRPGCDSPPDFVSTEVFLDGKRLKNPTFIDDSAEFNQHNFQNIQDISSSWPKDVLKLRPSDTLKEMDEDSLRESSIAMSIGSEQDRKCAQFGEDAGSVTSHDGIAKVAIDCMQQPEIKSQMKGRSSRKGKASGPALVRVGHLKAKRSAKDSSNTGKEQKPLRTRKFSFKPSGCLRGGNACLQSRCEPDKQTAGRPKKSDQGAVMQACLENIEKDEIQMEMQVKTKRKGKSERIASGVEVIETDVCFAFDGMAGKSRKSILDVRKLAPDQLMNPKGRQKRKVSETSIASALVVRETEGNSSLIKKQKSSSKYMKIGKKKTVFSFEGKVVGEDLYCLPFKVVADTVNKSFERCRTSMSTSLSHMGEQNIEGTITALKDNKCVDVVSYCDSMLVDTDKRCFTQLGKIARFAVAKKAGEEGFSGDLAATELTHNLETYAGVEEASCRLFEELEATTIGEDVSSGVTEADCPGQGKVSAQVEDYTGTKAGSGDGWVRCDDCRKWRCISTELADMIDTTAARWTCLDNPNKDFANCSVRQEKSNAQINAELELSDDTDDEEDEDKETAADSKSIEFFQGSQPTTWKLIRRNNFLHRQRKTHDNDDYVICHCKQPADGSPGCGDDCMNRMVSMECVPEICPCGEACSNQQFRKRMYANVALFRSGKKGFGLKALENVPKGSFITEYVGEVLDMPTFEARQKDYAQNGQKHFYFMTLNSSEVIDAYAKGNWGRFINHSCEPNCQTEKWCVNGEICIGLFAIRDLVQGEEITFDYHYEPVYGAAAKKCECGSSQCRGYIGGQPPLNPTSIVESESEEEEDPEPVMLEEESEDEVVNLEEKSVASAKRFHGGSEAALWEPRIARAGRLKRKRSFGSKPDELENSLKGSSESKRPKYSTFMRKYTGPKELLLEPNVGRQGWGRPSRSIQPSEVEGKLNELLDAHGGLEKRKDVAKQYMKLLVLSIASGETVHGGPSWSVRDLSLLLDAVLKTSSKSVLSDILQKNGLQLLHNLVKQSRRNWKKLPILRKLMKVLELLSLKKVLTDRHISCIPSRDGMESFMESIVQLTHHDDTEVYQIARRFKTKWFSVGAMYSHRSFGEKHSKSQNWHSHFQQPTSQQRILYGDSSSPPLPNESSGLRNISLKSLEKPASQSVHSGSFVSAERCSSVSMLHTATGILATSALIVEGERDHFESRKSHDSTLPNNCNINMVNERPSRDKRNSCWDQPAITDNVCSEHQQILAGDSEAGLGGNVGILEDVHQSPFSFVPSTGIRFNSCRQSSQGCNYYDQSPDGHQASARNEVARIESFQSLSDSPTIKIDSRASIKSGHTNHLRTQEHSKRPHRWFKGPNQPVRAKLSSQGSVMRSGALQTPSQGISSSAPRPGPYATSVHVQPQAMQARAPQGHPLMGMAPLQPYHQPPLPIGPFPGHQMSVHLSAPRGVAFSTPPRWQPGLQLPVLPSVPAASLSGPTQMPNGVSHNQPPRADSGNLQTTTGRGPGQVPLARAAFQSGLPATSPVFTNQGEFQSLQGSSARPHRAGYPFRSPEVFHCQGPPCVSENKLPMGRLGPSPTGASTYKRSDDGNRVPFVCRESMEGFEPEPPVPGL